MTRLSTAHRKFLAARSLDPDQSEAMGCFSGKHVRTGEDDWKVEVDINGGVLVFPYYEDGRGVVAKFRVTPKVNMYQTKGGINRFYNDRVFTDPDVLSGKRSALITEGELDTHAAVQSGYRWSTSVPDGAPAARDKNGRVIPMRPADQIDPGNDPKYRYVFESWPILEGVKHFVLACDDDEPGQRLRDELARRLGQVRCSFVVYPGDPVVKQRDGTTRACKDLNEVKHYFGADAVMRCILEAKAYPVNGLYRLSEFPDKVFETQTTGFEELDKVFMLYESMFMVVSGLPMAGKSQWVNQLVFNCAWMHREPGALVSLEEPVNPFVRAKFRQFYTQKSRHEMTDEDRAAADRFIEQRIVFISADGPDGMDENDPTLDWILDRATDAVIRDGIRWLVVDPWNEISHEMKPGETLAIYTNRTVRKLKAWGKRYGVKVIVVVHPDKAAGRKAEEGKPITLYDISDGATWANKAEIGVIISRPCDGYARITANKIKFQPWTGKPGVADLQWDDGRRQFVMPNTTRREAFVPLRLAVDNTGIPGFEDAD